MESFTFLIWGIRKIYDLALNVIRLSGLEPGRDIQIIETGLRPGEKLFEELLADGETTKATHHPKIFIADAQNLSLEQIESLIEVTQKDSTKWLVHIEEYQPVI